MNKDTEEKMNDWLHNSPTRFKYPDITLYELVQSIVENNEYIDVDVLVDSIHKLCPDWGERKVQELADIKDKEISVLVDFYKYIKK
jgi:hypothetical protein